MIRLQKEHLLFFMWKLHVSDLNLYQTGSFSLPPAWQIPFNWRMCF